MDEQFYIRSLKDSDIENVTKWSRIEGFAPGTGDVGIYKHTDQQGLWIGSIGSIPIGCIAGIRYNQLYGFIGLFLVQKEYRGKGYGLKLWQKAFDHLVDLPCIGLEAAPDRINDYSKWGFKPSSLTTRWKLITKDQTSDISNNSLEPAGLKFLEGKSISNNVVQAYDANREPTPRPHFLADWLNHPSGNVFALIDSDGLCHGFGRIRPCLLQRGKGWRIGPLLADTPQLAELLLKKLLDRHPGIVLIDSPGLNPFASNLLSAFGFQEISSTLRMYKGNQPPISMHEIYGLACLELG